MASGREKDRKNVVNIFNIVKLKWHACKFAD